MTDATRALRLLSASFALAWVGIALIAAPGPAAWVALSGDAGQAGVFFGVFSLSSAAGAAIGGRLMDRFARRPVLIGAHLGAAAGFALAGVAYARGSLALFAPGVVLLAAAIGAVYLTRLAAGEMFAPGERARAIARVQWSATTGALLGPLLLISVGSSGALVWFLAPPLFVVAALLVASAPEPMRLAQRHAAPGTSAPTTRASSWKPLAAGIAALACAQAAMVTVMGVAGASLVHAGHAATTTGLVMATHFVGMFALSTLVGRFADRTGRRPTILAGLATLAAGGVVVALVAGPLGLALGLLLIGLGWSFAYIGGTVILADVVPAAKRARVLGTTDFATALLCALASFAGGWWYGGHGIASLGLVAAAVVAAPLVLALPVREPAPGRYDAEAA